MATLVEQIRQMIDVLAFVDPEAALEFRGDPSNRLIRAAQPYASFPNTDPSTLLSKNAAPQEPDAGAQRQTEEMQRPANRSRVPVAPSREADVNPLRLDPKNDSLIKGILYSEILGKPVSARRRNGRAF